MPKTKKIDVKNIKQRVLFLHDHESGMPPFALNQPDVLGHIDVEMDQLDDGESIKFTITRKDMTQAELDALPEA